MESPTNNPFIISKHETRTLSSEETPEESSWTMYFEDIFEASSSVVDCSSSWVSDAESYVGTKESINVSKDRSNYSNKFNIKRTRNTEIPFARHHDLEDTASSPSRSPNVYSMMNLMDNNTRNGGGGVAHDTINVNGESAARNQGGLSIDLEKKGLCLVPLSMVTNFLG